MTLPAGTKVFIGPPAKPIAKEIAHQIGLGLAQIPEIIEAHLPMVYIKGRIDPPAQTLIVVIELPSPELIERISEVLRRSLPQNSYMDTVELSRDNPMLQIARNARCELKLGRVLN